MSVHVKSSVDYANEILVAEGERRVRELRVLDAARAWRTMQNKSSSISITAGTLMDAIDALDAPAERYVVSRWHASPATGLEHPWCVCDRKEGDRCIADAGDEEDAERIAAALNAAERKP